MSAPDGAAAPAHGTTEREVHGTAPIASAFACPDGDASGLAVQRTSVSGPSRPLTSESCIIREIADKNHRLAAKFRIVDDAAIQY